MPRWLNLANFFTLLRLVLVPFIISDIVDGRITYTPSFYFFVAALTDVIDGALARTPSAGPPGRRLSGSHRGQVPHERRVSRPLGCGYRPRLVCGSRFWHVTFTYYWGCLASWH